MAHNRFSRKKSLSKICRMIDIPPLTQIQGFLLETEQYKTEKYALWLARHVLSRQMVSIKIFSKKFIDSSEENTKYFNRELELFKSSTNPFIARYIHDFSDDNFYYIILEPLKGGSFMEYITEKTRLKETQARPYFIQLYIIIEYFQKALKYVLTNLSFEVFMLDESFNIRLFDLWGVRPITEVSTAVQTVKINNLFSPLRYQPPEFLSNQYLYQTIDQWSLGVIIYRIAVGDFPFSEEEGEEELKASILKNDVLYPKFLSNQLIDLMKKLLHTVPMQRITLDTIKQHPWFSTTQYNVLTPFLLKNIKFDQDVFDDVENFIESKEDLQKDLISKKTTPEIIIYRIAFALRSAYEVYNACASTTTIPTDSVRINSDSSLSMTSSRQFTSSPSMNLSSLNGTNGTNDRLKVKPLALQKARPVPIAARRSSNLLLTNQRSLPKLSE